MSFARVYRDGVCFGFVSFALLLAVVLCWVDRCFGSSVLPGSFCLLRATHVCAGAAALWHAADTASACSCTCHLYALPSARSMNIAMMSGKFQEPTSC